MKIIVTGIPGADGEYDFDPSETFTNRELHKIKEIAGVRMGEIEDALGAGDNDLLVAFTAIALTRAGKDVPVDAIWDARPGSVQFVVEEKDADEGDAADPPSVTPTGSVPSGGNNVRTLPSSEASRNIGDDPQETDLRATGAQV